MLELTVDQVAEFCRQRGWVKGPMEVEVLSGGVSGAVFRIRTPQEWLVLKQARAQLRTREWWVSDLGRIWREMEVMEALFPHLPPLTVPKVLQHDRENFAFLMTHAPEHSQVWKTQLLAGTVDPSVARYAGLVLGQIHQASAWNADLADRFLDRTIFEQLRVQPYYNRIQERLPDLAELIAPLIEELRTRQEAICHGDFSPKNILTHAQGFMLVDYETAHRGDPTMDLGFFLSHLLLKACRDPRKRSDLLQLTRTFWDSYLAQVTFRPHRELRVRSHSHLGVCLLARIDGTSPVDYLPEEPKRQAVRNLGRRLLHEPHIPWDTVLDWAQAEFGLAD